MALLRHVYLHLQERLLGHLGLLVLQVQLPQLEPLLVQLLQLVLHRHRLRGLERLFQLKRPLRVQQFLLEPRFLRFYQ